MSSGKPHRTGGYCASSPRKQRGFAFIIVLLGVVVASMTYIVHAYNNAIGTTAQRDAKTREALEIARDALIHYAATQNPERLGALPCPDRTLNNTGNDPGAACGNTRTRVGRLPWKALGFDAPLLDANGEPLWYAVSHCFIKRGDSDPFCGEYLVNSNTPGQLEVLGTGMTGGKAIAIVFSPGKALPQQQRQKGTASYIDATNYLEGENANGGDAAFENADERKDVFERRRRCEDADPAICHAPFNDQLLVIRAENLFPVVEAHVQALIERDIKPGLEVHYKAWGSYPYAAPFDGRELGRYASHSEPHPKMIGQRGTFIGFLPLNLYEERTHMEGWDPSCGPILPTSGNIKARLHAASLQGEMCRVSIDVCRKTDKSQSPLEFRLLTRLDGTDGWTGRGFFDSPAVRSYSDFVQVQVRQGSIAINGQGSARISVVPRPPKQWALCDDEDESESNWTTIEVILDAPRLISSLNPLPPEDSAKPDELKPTWFFRNEWYRVIAYRVPDRTKGAQLTIIHTSTEQSQAAAALLMAGPPLDEGKFQQRRGAPDACPNFANLRTGAYWSAYFELTSVPDCEITNEIDIQKPMSEPGGSRPPFNDRVIALR